MTPADELKAAATALYRLLDRPRLTPGPWESLDNGDRLVHDPGHDTDPPVYVVDEPIENAANAAWIAAMHPGVGAALASWIDATASYYTPGPVHPTHVVHALAVARAILAQPEGSPR